MGLFSKKNDESAKASNDLALEIIQDVQTHLKIKQKQEAPKMPLFISISKIPNPEIFATPLDNEIAEVDEAEKAENHKKVVAFRYIMCYITHRTNDTQIGGDQYEHSKIYTEIDRSD